jgi:thioesterase domain-containing protein
MTSDELRAYMFERIPLSQAMGVEIVTATVAGVVLSAPLTPNVNHQGTVFGGSASAVALLAAWALLHLRLTGANIDAAIVVKRYTMTYARPMPADFTAAANLDAGTNWNAFTAALARRGRARITVIAALDCDGERAGELQGEFVALSNARGGTRP